MRFHIVGLVGYGVTCSPRDQIFMGSYTGEVDGFPQGGEIPEEATLIL